MSLFHVVVWQRTSRNYSKVRTARAARLFVLIRPIKFLIYGVKHEGALYKGISLASSGTLETGTMHFYASRSNRELISLRDRTRNYK